MQSVPMNSNSTRPLFPEKSVAAAKTAIAGLMDGLSLATTGIEQ